MKFESGWYTGTAGATYYFSNGVSITEGSSTADAKFATKSASVSVNEITYAGTQCIQLGKKSNGSFITIPVKGDCIIRVLWNNNKSIAEKDSSSTSRGLYATTSATNSKISSVGGGNAGTSFYGYNDNTAYSAQNELATFRYSGTEGTVKLEVCKNSNGDTAGGACYIYLVDVATE